jgi:hypothetical protein
MIYLRACCMSKRIIILLGSCSVRVRLYHETNKGCYCVCVWLHRGNNICGTLLPVREFLVAVRVIEHVAICFHRVVGVLGR